MVQYGINTWYSNAIVHTWSVSNASTVMCFTMSRYSKGGLGQSGMQQRMC